MIIEFLNGVHLATLGAGLLLGLLLWLLLRGRTRKTQYITLLALACFNFALYFIKILLICREDWFLPWSNLPLDLCGINLPLTIVALLWKKEWLYNFLYFVGLLGAGMALLIPNGHFLGSSIFAPLNLLFYGSHMLLVIIPVLLASLGFFRPTLRAIPKTAGIMLCFSVGMYGINKLIALCTSEAPNYFFLIQSPGNPLLDLFWKWLPVEFFYALPCLVILAVADILLVLPFLRRKAEEK